MAAIQYQPASLSAALAMLPSLPRPVLSRLVTRMIQRIDEIDGEPDEEADGDELDFNAAEDDFCHYYEWRGEPGCLVADPGEEDDHSGGSVDDEGEREDGTLFPAYGIDQSTGPLSVHPH